jgi:hypothetical protein
MMMYNNGYPTRCNILVSLSPAQAQPLEQAKVDIITASFFFFSSANQNLIKEGISGRIVENKS